MLFSWPDKTVRTKRVYGIDWTNRLGGRTVAAVETTVQRGSVLLEDEDFNDTKTVVWISEGLAGEICVVHTLVTLSDGQKLEGIGEFKII